MIVCVGNAIKGADALPRYRRLAERLGGKVACTRPVFDRGVLPFKLVIGQSGAVVKPKLLLSFGVSGAVNHVTGFSDADVVVAVNTDPEGGDLQLLHLRHRRRYGRGLRGHARKARRVSRDKHAKKHPRGCFFACCPPCRRRHSPAGSAAGSPSGAKDIGMQPMSASDAASSKIRAGQRAYHKTKSKKGPGICKVLFSGTPGWIRTSGLPLRRRPLYPTELRGHNSVILAQRAAGVNDRRRKRAARLRAAGNHGMINRLRKGGSPMRLIREEKTFIREAVLLMLPMILQNFVTFSMSMADTFMVGVLGETALAAVTDGQQSVLRHAADDLRRAERHERARGAVPRPRRSGGHQPRDGHRAVRVHDDHGPARHHGVLHPGADHARDPPAMPTSSRPARRTRATSAFRISSPPSAACTLPPSAARKIPRPRRGAAHRVRRAEHSFSTGCSSTASSARLCSAARARPSPRHQPRVRGRGAVRVCRQPPAAAHAARCCTPAA